MINTTQMIMQIIFDSKIPLWGVIAIFLTYTGALIGYFIRQHINHKVYKIQTDNKIKHLNERVNTMETESGLQIKALKAEVNEKFEKVSTKMDMVEKKLTEATEAIIRMSTVVEMKLLGEMRRDKTKNNGN